MIGLSIDELFEYTEWERGKWRDRLHQHGESVLDLAAGPHGDGRFETVRDLLKHIFAAEKRYVERLTGRPLTDHASIPSDSLDVLFQFGSQSRRELKELVAAFPSQDWNTPRDYKILSYSVNATPRKIVMHTLMHEIRHWAQIGTLLRLNGIVDEFHDFLGSPVMGGHFTKSVSKDH